ncbi:MAG: hydroxymethylbilane synthase [Acidobacteriota bacterium]
MRERTYRIGTRGSPLALYQANLVMERLAEKFKEIKMEVKVIKTRGDVYREAPLDRIGSTGAFVKEIQEALLSEEVDLAVHSMKDLPTEEIDGLRLAAVLERGSVSDALITRNGSNLDDLPAGSVIGTGSVRRKAQIMARRPDIECRLLRGNVDTRLRKLKSGDYDAIILSYAGMERLKIKDVRYSLLLDNGFLPAVGQGAIGVEVRDNDSESVDVVSAINHHETFLSVIAERNFLKRLGGGCIAPIAAFAKVHSGRMTLKSVITSPDGSRMLKDHIEGEVEEEADAANLGKKLAELLIARGAEEILGKRI